MPRSNTQKASSNLNPHLRLAVALPMPTKKGVGGAMSNTKEAEISRPAETAQLMLNDILLLSGRHKAVGRAARVDESLGLTETLGEVHFPFRIMGGMRHPMRQVEVELSA
jgi:hypothetical protein